MVKNLPLSEFESEPFPSGEVTVHPASWPSRLVTWNKIPPNDNIQFQLCQRVLSAPVQSPSKTKGEGAWRGNSSFLLLWHVVTWTPWKTSPVIPTWGPLYSTGRGCRGHDLLDRLCWNMPRCVETDLNKFIANAGDWSLCGLPWEAEYRLVYGLIIHIRLYSPELSTHCLYFIWRNSWVERTTWYHTTFVFLIFVNEL